MKKLRVWSLGLLLVLSLTACGKAQAPPAEEPKQNAEAEQTETPAQPQEEVPAVEAPAGMALELPGYVLTERGALEDPEGQVSVYDGVLIRREEHKQVLGTMGEDLQIAQAGFQNLGHGLIAVAENKQDLNNMGLVTAEGQVLIPFDAAYLDWLSYHRENPRYLLAAYATEPTTDEDQCFVYATDRLVAVSVQEGDDMYKGYGRIYDTQARAFVPGVELSQDQNFMQMDSTGDTFLIIGSDGMSRVYDSQGQVLLETENLLTTEAGLYLEHDVDEHKTKIYEGGKLLNTLRGIDFELVHGPSRTLLERRGGLCYLSDLNGEHLAPGCGYTQVVQERDGLFLVKLDDRYGLVKADGTEVCPLKYDRLQYIAMGVYSGETGDTYALISSQGVLLEGLSENPNRLDVLDGTRAYVFRDGGYTLELGTENVQAIGPALLKVRGENGYGLWDLTNGQQLLEPIYEDLDATETHVYGLQNGSWTIWSLSQLS